ncbi:T9SS type A sorting domain-containing protein [Paracrocinitomix mangrovi]|uniref:T9SS type A sorting domain-containing protein n=1 Tax=Paracrocinitomix mangrovi TaxID=2862509 RepID=UPI001C8E6DF7|nr:T9SS type A sorting domain-containing protein [Paracrocinitomix mangrovi]UKN00110.1 T9SS type A sorting domain-containing protein [Paracrocinitomix mangrovi]
MKFSLLILLILPVLFCTAQSGGLKGNFGSGGKLSINIDDLDELVGLFKDDSGNTYFYGNTSDYHGGVYPTDFFIGKLDEFGNLDNSFGTNGIFRSDFPGYSTSSINQAIWHNNEIYFIGQGINPSEPDTFLIFISNLSANGQIDNTFSNNGFFTDDFLGSYNTAGSIIIDSQNKLVFCGSTTDDQGTLIEYALIGRMDLDGNLDVTFGSTGVRVWDTFGGSLIDAYHLPPSYDRHGEGAYLSEIVEINNNYFVCGKYVATSFTQLHFFSVSKQGDINPDFISYGPQIFQIDPGYNHWVQDIAFNGEDIIMAIRTDGPYFEGHHLLQKVDTIGVIGDIIDIEKSGYSLRTNFLEMWNNKLFVGGYSLNNNNAGPGYHSDDFLAFCLNDQFDTLSEFQFNHNFNSGDELGARDIEMHNDYGVIAGFMNVNIDTNFTDLAFMAFNVESTLEIQNESQNSINIYPNPSSTYIQIENYQGYYEIHNFTGQKIKSGLCDSQIDIADIPNGCYLFKTANSIEKFVIQK